jgi:hypothetical protein
MQSLKQHKEYQLLDLNKNNVSKLAESGFEFELLLPGSREPTGAFITVRGDSSPVIKAYARKKYSEYQMKMQAAKRRGKEVEDITPEEAEDMSIESAIQRVIGWRGINESGVDVEFNKENAARIFREHSWIKEQVFEEASNLLNFRPD